MKNCYKKWIALMALMFFAISVVAQNHQESWNVDGDMTLVPGHAHNDYANKHPLHDALKNGFISVEVDVHLMHDQIYVSHDSPKELKTAMTLETMYLKPLKKHVEQHNGCVYPGYEGDFYLMVDFKTAANPTYRKLISVLEGYSSLLALVENGKEKKGPVPKQEQKKLQNLVRKTHSQKKKLRLWAAPDKPVVWEFLLANGVDLINTDRLEAFREYYMKYQISLSGNLIF